ncbi:hypothetical protein Psed_6055 [Pseudonocardia dioxanivorans CB1190]|uniref:Uncharacterized protein n=1 Tax=Pseudonocardia dioxanivorans (strain ATCC 55486 / DSM 44775 / JCM 13855 / CB1190) TaxID=675635 RepID=F4CK58_PSEUX|nr:hypothetical protein Psed_6055 [Pseudonocardia dioxanivorans CB1190]
MMDRARSTGCTVTTHSGRCGSGRTLFTVAPVNMRTRSWFPLGRTEVESWVEHLRDVAARP